MTPSASTPRVSIIVATWNSGRTLEKCLRSIDEQAFRSWEIIVVDGGSRDDTLSIVERNKSIIAYWHSAPDDGIYDAWNQALDHARGEYVCFLGSDDAYHSPESLQQVFGEIGSDEFDLVTARGELIDSDGRSHTEFGNPWNYRKVAKRMTICHPGALHRRDLFDHHGKFDTTYRISADYDFLLRLPPNLRSLHVNLVLVDIEDGGISRKRRWLMLRERYRAQANCPRIGPVRAAFNYLDKLWRIPVAKLLGIPN